MSNILVILAGGQSKRLKIRVPKPYLTINNKPLIQYSIDVGKSVKVINKIVVVYNNNHRKLLAKHNFKNIIKIKGGKSRAESTFNALKRIKKFNCRNILIHDAARPNPSKELIRKIITELKNSHAVVPIIKTNDATKRIEKNTIFKNIRNVV